MKNTQKAPLAAGKDGAYSKDTMALGYRAVSDILFKFIFGAEESTDILKAFVNAVLSDAGYPQVKDLKVTNPVNQETYLDEKISVIDTRAREEAGNPFNLEVQVRSRADFQDRSLYYWANAYAGQLPEGHEYRMLHKVVSISILDFALFPEYIPFHSCFMLRETSRTDYVLTQDCVMHYLETPKLQQEPETELEKWLYLLLHAGKKDEKMKVMIDQNEYFKKAVERYTCFVSDEQARLAYEGRQKFLHDQASSIGDAFRQGLAEGREQGLKEGRERAREKENQKIAKNLIGLGLLPDKIAEATGLSVEEVKELSSS